MAAKKVKVPPSWNAKPVTKVGGGSGGVRKPSKPYTDKPKGTKTEPPARWDTKPPKPAAKPPAKPNSKSSAPASNTRAGGATTMPNSARAGVSLPRTGAQVERAATQGPTLKGSKPPAKPPTTAKPPTAAAPSPKPSTPNFSMAGARRLLGGVLSAAGSTEMLLGGSRMLGDQLERSGITKAPKGSKTLAEREKAPAKPKPTDRSSLRYEKLFDTKGGRGNYGLDKPTPVAPLPASVRQSSSGGGSGTPSRGGSTPSRSGSSSPARSSTPAAPAKPGQKFADFNPGRGTSKTNNPLMKDMIARMKDREDKAQSSAASKLTNKFNTNDNFSSEKVDGSKVDTKAKMSSTTSEYDKKKRRYGG